jgi:oligosaccharide repeat unit polymerase
MTLLLLTVILILLYGTLRKHRDFFHPTRIYILIYSSLFAIYFLRLTRVQEPWSSTTTMLFICSVVLFIGSGALYSFYVNHLHTANFNGNYLQTITQRLQGSETSVDWDWFIKCTGVIFSFFVLSYLFCYQKYGFIPITSRNPGLDRFYFTSGNLLTSFGAASGPLVLMLSAEILIVKVTTRRQKLIAAAMLLIAFSLYFTFVTRMPLIRSFIYIAVIYHYMRKRISFQVIILFAVVSLILFLVGALVRIDISGFAEMAQTLRIDLPLQYLYLTNTYIYAVNNIWNMDFAFKKFIDGIYAYNMSYGFDFFRAFLFFVRADVALEGSYNFDSIYNESIAKVGGLNTVIYVWHFYKDFGIAGIAVFSLLISNAIHVFYYNTILRPSHIRVAVLGLIITMIVFSFMIPLWSFWNAYYEAAVIIVAHKALKLV